MTPAELFHRAGVALFGAEFVAPLAKALKVEKGSVRKMANGQSRIPPGVWAELEGMAQKRSGELEEVAELIANLADQEWQATIKAATP